MMVQPEKRIVENLLKIIEQIMNEDKTLVEDKEENKILSEENKVNKEKIVKQEKIVNEEKIVKKDVGEYAEPENSTDRFLRKYGHIYYIKYLLNHKTT